MTLAPGADIVVLIDALYENTSFAFSISDIEVPVCVSMIDMYKKSFVSDKSFRICFNITILFYIRCL